MNTVITGGRKLPKEVTETLRSLAAQGIKWSIANLVEYRVELHLERPKYVKGCQVGYVVEFVAELDEFGNVTKWGECHQDDGWRKPTDVILTPEDFNRV